MTTVSLEELWDGEMRPIVVENKRLLLLRVGNEVRVWEDRCAHLGVPLSEGKLEGRVLTCSAHGWQYDALTGDGINPKRACLRRCPVEFDGDVVRIGER
jgi:toluene monooxygenase system ferredoxin subunit